MNKILSFFKDMVTDRAGGTNSKIFVGLLGFVVLCVGLFVGVEEKLYYIFAMCDVFYFGGTVVDNWTAPKIEVSKKETKEIKTEIDTAKVVENFKSKKK